MTQLSQSDLYWYRSHVFQKQPTAFVRFLHFNKTGADRFRAFFYFKKTETDRLARGLLESREHQPTDPRA